MIEIREHINTDLWNKFLESHSFANPFQSNSLYNFYLDLHGHHPLSLFAVDKNGEIVGCLIAVILYENKRLTKKLTSRVILSGGPLISSNENNKIILDLLIKSLIKKVSKSTIYIEIRNFFEWEPNLLSVFKKNKFDFEDHLNFIVPLENILPSKKFSSSKQRQIKKGLSNGAEIVKASTIAEIFEFYKILSDLYNNKAKKPLAPWLFFKNFFEFNCTKNEGIYLLVKYKAKIIGGIMCILYNNKTVYEWYVCGLDLDYKQCYPSVLATWSAIDYAHNNDYKYFDFMGAGSPNTEYGVRNFKEKFGGYKVNYGRFILINKPILYFLGKLGLKLFSLIRLILK